MRVNLSLISELIADLDRYYQSLYPPQSTHLESIDSLSAPQTFVLGAYVQDKLIGIGAVKSLTRDYGEIKRMFVRTRYRGQGVAQKILSGLERHLFEENIPLVRLETGIHQKEALSFYKSMGFQLCGPFGDYKEDPLSLFMEKHLIAISYGSC